MDDDEKQIAAGYRNWFTHALAAAPIITAIVADTEWVVAVSAAAIILLLHESGGRLYDLCIRLKRTNMLLRERDNHH